jgi:hypothetical protein
VSEPRAKILTLNLPEGKKLDPENVSSHHADLGEFFPPSLSSSHPALTKKWGHFVTFLAKEALATKQLFLSMQKESNDASPVFHYLHTQRLFLNRVDSVRGGAVRPRLRQCSIL